METEEINKEEEDVDLRSFKQFCTKNRFVNWSDFMSVEKYFQKKKKNS